MLTLQTADIALHFALLLGAALSLMVLLGAAFVLDPVAALLVLFAGAVVFGLLSPLRTASRRAGRSFLHLHTSLAEEVAAWTALAMEHRAFGVGSLHAERLGALSDQTSAAFGRSRFATRMGSVLLRDVAVLLLVVAVGVLDVVEGVDLAVVGTVVLLIVRSLSYAQGLQASLQLINERLPSLERLLDRLASLEADRAIYGDRNVDSFEKLRVAGVSYRYGDDTLALSDVSFDLDAGDVLGIIGPSGGGKSTLVQLLLRLRTPTEGALYLDGLDYQDVAPESWTRLVALVSQEPRLVEGTIVDNIAFGRGWIDRDQVREAAAAANVLAEIEALSAGLDTKLGPRGAGLSGGQKQRVAIARALAGRPELLVLDEPTSALDMASEQRFQQSIRALHGKATLVIVAHRMSTLSLCDRVIALSDGRLVAIGSLEDALASVDFEDVPGPSVESDGPEESSTAER